MALVLRNSPAYKYEANHEDSEEDDYFPTGQALVCHQDTLSHIVLVVDTSASMRRCDVAHGHHRQRLAAVLHCCQELVRKQVEDGAGGVCSLVTFDDHANTEFAREWLLGAESLLANSFITPKWGTQYLGALEEVLEVCDSYPAEQTCVVFLSDGLPGDLHMNSAKDEERLYDALDFLKASCKDLYFHTIGFGAVADFVWLKKMASAIGGKFWNHGMSREGTLSMAELLTTFRTISNELTQARSSSADSRRLTLHPALPAPTYYPGPPSTWETITGDLLEWDSQDRTLHTTSTSIQAQIWTTAFEQGGMRRAHDFQFTPTSQLVLRRLQLPSSLVAKDSRAGRQSQKQAFKEMVGHFRSLQLAQLMAADINQRLCEGDHVHFLQCYGFKCTFQGRPRYLYLEPYLEGPYIKFNGNNGYVKDKHGLSYEDVRAHELAQAFSHYTWVRTGGQCIVSDIQGVGNTWTDPQVNSVTHSFGVGDCGPDGIERFFSTHRCNGFCRMLGITGNWPRS